jgi:hypothetical protein
MTPSLGRARILWIPLLAVVMTAMVAACGQSRQASSGDLVGVGSDGTTCCDSTGSYQAPILDATRIANFRAANKLLSFEALRPQDLGRFRALFINDPSRVPVENRAIAAVFDSPRYGRVNVVQEPMGLPRAEYDAENRALLAENGSPLTHGSVSIVTVRNDKQALITTAESGSISDIFWMEHAGVEISITGPLLNATDCVYIANRI